MSEISTKEQCVHLRHGPAEGFGPDVRVCLDCSALFRDQTSKILQAADSLTDWVLYARVHRAIDETIRLNDAGESLDPGRIILREIFTEMSEEDLGLVENYIMRRFVCDGCKTWCADVRVTDSGKRCIICVDQERRIAEEGQRTW